MKNALINGDAEKSLIKTITTIQIPNLLSRVLAPPVQRAAIAEIRREKGTATVKVAVNLLAENTNEQLQQVSLIAEVGRSILISKNLADLGVLNRNANALMNHANQEYIAFEVRSQNKIQRSNCSDEDKKMLAIVTLNLADLRIAQIQSVHSVPFNG